MISLRLKIKGEFSDLSPYIIKLENDKNFHVKENVIEVNSSKGFFSFIYEGEQNFHGDICIIFPESKSLLRQFRAHSTSNTILLTEQCDQACIMCSQPPKNKIYDFYSLYKKALMLVPENMVIGISGGEPTLEKNQLFPFIKEVIKLRPDLRFHILTNCQHFNMYDVEILKEINPAILWGIPLYSHQAGRHDEIVGKPGAFDFLLNGFNILLQSGASIEIRTVLMQQNFNDLPMIADFISRHLSACELWAIMQLEKIGYAKMNWEHIFVDSSINFSPISNALNISRIKEINCQLYNFPLCTIPNEWHEHACRSISDWKNEVVLIV